ncbi:MAG: rod shape-determining protein [Planctomycetota bacterium]|jgi:rod shape-determining protein MreB|nr:rod shape-determining protein [Planctomycetota bacterium]
MIQNLVYKFFSTDMGIDLGTANTLVYVRGKGVVLNEPSVVAVKQGTNKVINDGNAVGTEAKKMLGLTPPNIEAIRPLKDGVIADFDTSRALLSYFIRKVHNNRLRGLYRPQVVIAIPSGINEVEKRAVVNSAERAGARKVYLIEEPKAAGIGAGLPVEEARGSMVVDIGGGTTEVAVLSLAGIVSAESVGIGGDEMDEAIIDFMRDTHNLQIGGRTAEQIKMKIGSAWPLEKEITLDVRGYDLTESLPRKVSIHSESVREALRGPVDSIIDTIKRVLEATPPELAGDLVDSGMTLAGGGALLRGLNKAIAESTKLPVRTADDPLTCVARGTGITLENPLLMSVLEEGIGEVG